MIGIVDYGSGNLRSVYNAFKYLGQEVKVCTAPDELKVAEKVVLPGVGSSADAMKGLAERGLDDVLRAAIEDGKPFLGICLGLQLLFAESEESGGCSCLGLLRGKVRRFPENAGGKVPQIGWNTVDIGVGGCPILKGLNTGDFFYFVHSYYCDNEEPEYTACSTDYGVSYTSAIWKDNMYAVQFHPERSQANGIKLLRNFVEL